MAGVHALAIEPVVRAKGPKIANIDIARSVFRLLAWAATVPDRAIQVVVEDGWVTLCGAVEWQYQRQDAAGSVRYLPGVTGVSNLISIDPSLPAEGLQSHIEAALKRRTDAGGPARLPGTCPPRATCVCQPTDGASASAEHPRCGPF